MHNWRCALRRGRSGLDLAGVDLIIPDIARFLA